MFTALLQPTPPDNLDITDIQNAFDSYKPQSAPSQIHNPLGLMEHAIHQLASALMPHQTFTTTAQTLEGVRAHLFDIYSHATPNPEAPQLCKDALSTYHLITTDATR